MVDYLSRYRLYGLGYISPDRRKGVTSYRDLYHDTAPFIFNRRPQAHNCRSDGMQSYVDNGNWEAWLFSHGLDETFKSVDKLRNAQKELTPNGTKAPDKLLFNLGRRGIGDGDFNYPRGIGVTIDGEILVADTMNHRIQIINQQGIFVRKFGCRGSENGQFNEPTGVTELPNGDIAVADKKNKRVQIFGDARSRRKFKFMFTTADEPFAIVSDSNFNMVVSTTNRTIEVYRRTGKLLHKFPIGGKSRDRVGCQICVNDKDEVILSDTMHGLVKIFTYAGKLLYQFKPEATGEGLSLIPSGICLTPLGDIILGDALNHTVNVYSERGVVVKQLIGPSDNAGAINTCAVGPEGHLIVTEFSLAGPHSLKIFRYLQCYCHLTRPGSSRRRTPTPKLNV